jgi:hypothetical protein
VHLRYKIDPHDIILNEFWAVICKTCGRYVPNIKYMLDNL